ncbi:long-chain fatty acid--CoA ligase [Roseicella frigidaeris]|uniref:Long-chain fatty acid--CoA ligase n=1 Tax=Roseicella frigidaeris TaxID=2230885 RepID=A0A327M5F9_9PROT|nr:long-chain fatty acid--CoA ligase [Roseicella frigidaeris]RAI57544.1 long-chain fatty acid--CoA ligase [Roseicella frigidaeris]
MLGLMQHHPLLLSSILTHAARHHGRTEVVSALADGGTHRIGYAALEARARRLAQALHRLGVRPGDRVATLAWNSHRHLELYYAVSGMGAVCHTVNPRLSEEDIAFILNDAADAALFADPGFAPLVAALAPRVPALRTVVLLGEGAPPLPPGIALHDYETLLAAESGEQAWPVFDENTASALCYTSGTTGRPKGVLYSHRSAMLHAYAANTADAFAFRATDRVLVGAGMFHATGWAMPYCAPMAGAALVLPGRHLDGASLLRLLNEERVTFASAVPTIWLDVLQVLERSGARLETLRRVASGGSAVPRAMIEGLARHGVAVQQAWGMTETSPMVTINAPLAAHAGLEAEAAMRVRLKQGRALCGADIRITDAEGAELPWDGTAFGDLEARGHWVCQAYLNRGAEGAADADGWFRTGDVASIDPEGYAEMVDRSKDVIKSGGEWISSIQLENIAVSHPDVLEAAVIAAHHPRWQERPLLLVVPKPGRALAPESVAALYEDGRVARWWRPDAVLLVEALPHTATGKLNKRALRQDYQDYLLRQPPG